MKTDTLFHEYFQLVPEALLELFQITPACRYQFSSPVLKGKERRLDGLLEPKDPQQPRYFLELQGYPDEAIYWRLVEELGRFHSQKPKLGRGRWHAFLLFLDAAYDPGLETLGDLYHGNMPWLTTGVLSDLLPKLTHPSPALNVLQPLIVATPDIIRGQASSWISSIQQNEQLDSQTQNRLIELLVQFVVQRFSQLSRQEIDQMLQLTPLEKTKAGQELMDLGFKKGMERGMERGMEQGMEQGELNILIQQISYRFAVSPETVQIQLKQCHRDDLEALATYLWQAQSYQDIEQWLNKRLRQSNR
ncbi:MAG: Rpn family recombination-promoting nuclease/putative transposase [Anaerolineae bacterium]|nr:Rpn family recombination-promoting nuclease/putative transposase [Anaerolineae bacterium]